MKRHIMLSAVAAIILGVVISGSAAGVCDGFLPPNNLKIPVGSSDDKGIAQEQFNAVLDTVEKLYAQDLAAQGKVLEIRRLWDNATVNASAQQQGNRYILNMYGGLARHETITMDGFALVACHEMGHHLGGAPRKGYSWASNEGQADYYANLKCLRRIFSDSSSAVFTRSAAGDALAEKACEGTFKGSEEIRICKRNTRAGKSVAALFRALRQEEREPSFDTPDTAVVSSMYDNHPGTQCRMDTYLQGSLCTQPVSAGLSNTNPATGTCTRSGGFSTGFRPLCWYKPASASELLPSVAVSPVVGAARGLSVAGPAFSSLQSENLWQGF